MVKLRPKNIEEVNANKVAPDFAKWCNNKSDCMYKDKKRKYHGWLNLDNLTKKNKVAQCGWDNGNCNHTTKHGIGGYSNVCPIGGFNGDLPWPAVIRLSKFDFAGHVWTVVPGKLALCDDFIGYGCFRKDWRAIDANEYEASDVKKYIENWFNQQIS